MHEPSRLLGPSHSHTLHRHGVPRGILADPKDYERIKPFHVSKSYRKLKSTCTKCIYPLTNANILNLKTLGKYLPFLSHTNTMIHTQTGSNRRILSFPAVNPCKSISITTLVDSLLQIAGDILSFKTKHLSTNKRNAKETLRHVRNLVILFEEIRVRSIPTGRRAILSLSELHVIFQKLKFLLEDCTRDGAQLYMLINSVQVSAHFRVLIRSMSTCLDTFRVGSVDLPEEVNELMYLVIRQTCLYEPRPDWEDKRAIDSVYWFFNLFENRINPNRDEVLRVLDHIGVRKWRDCVKEMDFIGEEMLEEKKENKSKAQIELLSSLMGFISYCRCVILGGIDEEDEDNDDKEEEDNSNIRGLNVDDLRCPISLEVMSDPVVLETGHTYDRSSIAKWFASGNITCPKTGKNLVSTVLVDNVSVKQVIQSYFEITQKRKKKTAIAPESLAAEEAGKLIADFIAGELIKGGEKEMVKALVEIRVLTKTSSFNRYCLVEAGVVESLMKILRWGSNPTIQENAMAGILNLSKDISGKSRIAGDDGGLKIIVEILNEGAKRESRQYAAAALFYLSSLGEDYSRLIGEIPDAIPGLLRLVQDRDYGDSAKRNALIAIRSLLIQQPDNHWRVLAAGAIPVLLDLIRSGDTSDGLTADSVAILAKMAEYPDGMISVIRRGGLKLAVKILGSPEVSSATKQHCVVLLLNLCVNGGSDVVGAIAKNPSIMESLYTALGNGDCGKKASSLIRMIHEFQERKTGPVLERDRFIHAW